MWCLVLCFSMILQEPEARSQLARFGVDSTIQEQLIGTLSGGQKSRVSFSVITQKQPHILVLDGTISGKNNPTLVWLQHALHWLQHSVHWLPILITLASTFILQYNLPPNTDYVCVSVLVCVCVCLSCVCVCLSCVCVNLSVCDSLSGSVWLPCCW